MTPLRSPGRLGCARLVKVGPCEGSGAENVKGEEGCLYLAWRCHVSLSGGLQLEVYGAASGPVEQARQGKALQGIFHTTFRCKNRYLRQCRVFW